MIFNLKKIKSLIKKNIELFLLISLIIISTIAIDSYKKTKKIVNKKYIELANNLYFKKRN